MAAGRPVIAFGRGGALETVVPPGGGAADRPLLRPSDRGRTGGRDRRFESGRYRFEPKALRLRAEAFDRALFKERIHTYLMARLKEHGGC